MENQITEYWREGSLVVEDWGEELKNASDKEQLEIIKECLIFVRDNLKISTEDAISLLLYIDPYNTNPPMGIDEGVVKEVYLKMRKFNFFIKHYVFNNDNFGYRLDGRKVSFSYLRNYLSENDSFGWLKFVTRRNYVNDHLYLCCVKKNIAKIKAAMVEAFTKLLNLN